MQEQHKLTQLSKGGGCGCKIAPSVLQQLLQTDLKTQHESLLVGNETADDAAVYKLDDENCIISTADFFLPIVDDAFDFGSVAAANAISDVYAMGGKPLMAIAILGWPIDKLPAELAREVLNGARAICKDAGIPLAGGHSIDSADPIFGLSVTGSCKTNQLKRNSTAREGDLLFLTKPIGVGVFSTAMKRGVLKEQHYSAMIEQMTSLNKIGESLAYITGVSAMTDVTGFGVLGHLIEMSEGSGLGAEIHYNAIKKIEGVEEYLAQKTIPDATFRNWNSYSSQVEFGKGINVMEAFNLLPDPQTNGGLLIAVVPEAKEEVVQLFLQNGLADYVNPVGRCTTMGEKRIVVK